VDTGIFKRNFNPFQDRMMQTNFADIWRNCKQILVKIFGGWDIRLATNHSILVMVQIIIQSQEFFKQFLLWDNSSCKNYAGSVALADICGLLSASSCSVISTSACWSSQYWSDDFKDGFEYSCRTMEMMKETRFWHLCCTGNNTA